MTRRRGQGSIRGLAVAGRAASPRPSDASPTARRQPAHGTPGDRPPAVPAVSRCRARQHHGQAENVAQDAPIAVNVSQDRDRCAAHCPGWSLQPQGRSLRSRELASLALDPGASASPAGLTARARPEGLARMARGYSNAIP